MCITLCSSQTCVHFSKSILGRRFLFILQLMEISTKEAIRNQLRLLRLAGYGDHTMLGVSENSLSRSWRYMLLAKFLPPLPFRQQLLSAAIRRAVGLLESEFSMNPIDDNLYCLRFCNEADYCWARQEQPIIICHSVVVLADWDGVPDYRRIVLDEFFCWVQVNMLNPLSLRPELAKEFLTKAGTFVQEAGERNFYL